MNDFEYMQPNSLQEASKHLTKSPKAKVYAGGTDILGLIKDHVIAPPELVNIKNISNLDYIKFDKNEGLKIGALTKLITLTSNSIVKENYTALYEAAQEVATPQIRNVGTVGGNICQRPRCFYFRQDYDCIRKGGDPCYALTGNNKYHCIVGGGPCYIVHPSDIAVALLAFNAEFKIFNGKKDRIVPASDFFVLPETDDMKENILNDGDILAEIIVPVQKTGNISKFIKVKERGAWDFSLVSIAGVFEIQNKLIRNGKLSFGGVAPIPWEEESVNKALNEFNISEDTIKSLSDLAFVNVDPLEMNSYKIAMAKNLVVKLMTGSFNI